MTQPQATMPSTAAPPAGALAGLSSNERRGLLDIKVNLSNPDPTAGSTFTVYMLVTNLFDVPIWPEQPQVFLPSEVRTFQRQQNILPLKQLIADAASGVLPLPERLRRKIGPLSNVMDDAQAREVITYIGKSIQSLDEMLTRNTERATSLRSTIDQALAGKSLAEQSQLTSSDPELQRTFDDLNKLNQQNTQTLERIGRLTNTLALLHDSSVVVATDNLALSNVQIASNLYVQANGDITINTLTQQSVVSMDSSLRVGEALQPGNTVVYTLPLITTRSMLFRPIQYVFQYSINYAFDQNRPATHTNTISQPVTIRAPITSVMTGAALGGMAGYFARVLPTMSETMHTQSWLNPTLALIVTVILSTVAVVFLARKSETQSLVSIEDFWGGLVIGFLVGYTGTSAFQSLANIQEGASNLVPAAAPPQ
jgi:hypothetical protein